MAHMLSGAMATMTYLSSERGDEFVAGDKADVGGGQAHIGSNGSSRTDDAVWFDVLGRFFAVFSLTLAFAVSVALLLVGPVVLLLLSWAVAKSDRWYFFATKIPPTQSDIRDSDDDQHDEPEAVKFYGWYGATRVPVALTLASGLVIASALLLHKVNPLIVYRGIYVV